MQSGPQGVKRTLIRKDQKEGTLDEGGQLAEVREATRGTAGQWGLHGGAERKELERQGRTRRRRPLLESQLVEI